MDKLKPCPFCSGHALDSIVLLLDVSGNPRVALHGGNTPIADNEKPMFCPKCGMPLNRRADSEDKKHGLETVWETPDRCIYCGEHLAREWSYCPECGRPTDPVKPLTLEELGYMDGNPVWVKEAKLYAILSVERNDLYVYGKYGMDIPFCWNVEQHGLTLYARKPEGSAT